MSRTHHPKWKARRYVLRNTNYARHWLRVRDLRDAEDLVAGELEYRDVVVPGGIVPGVHRLDVAVDAVGTSTLDYTSLDAVRAAWDEAVTVHHRRPARRGDNAVARRLMKRLRTWRMTILPSGGSSRGRGWVVDTAEPARPSASDALASRGWDVAITIQISF